MNTMKDLRKEVASRLRNSLHGREIDMIEEVRPRLPHMLGITPLNKVHDPQNEEGTLLDTDHQFWQDWHKSVETKAEASRNIETAIHSLSEDGVFRMTYPYGEEAEIAYVEVDKIESDDTNILQTSCKNCDTLVRTVPNLLQKGKHYYINVTVDCPECEFSGTFERSLRQQ